MAHLDFPDRPEAVRSMERRRIPFRAPLLNPILDHHTRRTRTRHRRPRLRSQRSGHTCPPTFAFSSIITSSTSLPTITARDSKMIHSTSAIFLRPQ